MYRLTSIKFKNGPAPVHHARPTGQLRAGRAIHDVCEIAVETSH